MVQNLFNVLVEYSNFIIFSRSIAHKLGNVTLYTLHSMLIIQSKAFKKCDICTKLTLTNYSTKCHY